MIRHKAFASTRVHCPHARRGIHHKRQREGGLRYFRTISSCRAAPASGWMASTANPSASIRSAEGEQHADQVRRHEHVGGLSQQ